MQFSKNPIIDRFLQLTLEEGKSVRGVALCHCPDSVKTVVFSLGDGSDCPFNPGPDNGSLMSWWQDTSRLVKNLRQVDLSPAC